MARGAWLWMVADSAGRPLTPFVAPSWLVEPASAVPGRNTLLKHGIAEQEADRPFFPPSFGPFNP